MDSITLAFKDVRIGKEKKKDIDSAFRWWVVLCIVFLLSTFYTAQHMYRGWVPHDEGTLAQSAERVLEGELPHRDFDEIYTGGGTYLHALAFRFFGVNLGSLRIILFIFFLLWIPALFYSATRFTSPLGAAGVVLLAVVWTLPNYFASIPSWYNLFFAQFCLAASLRYIETDRKLYLFTAGIFAGLSCLIKIIGLYTIVAILLFLVFREQTLSREQDQIPNDKGCGYSIFLGFSLSLFAMLLFLLVSHRFGTKELVHFVIPGTSIATLLMWRERGEIYPGTLKRFKRLLAMVCLFLAGAALPFSFFLIPYIITNSLPDLFYGLFVLPTKRLGFASAPLPYILPSLLATYPLLILLFRTNLKSRKLHIALSIGVLILCSVLLFTAENVYVYQFVWYSIRTLVPVLTIIGITVLVTQKKLSTLICQRVMLVLCLAAMFSLIQFPFSVAIYFCYTTPLVILMIQAIFSTLKTRPKIVPSLLLAFFLLFGILWVNRGFIWFMSIRYFPDQQTQVLSLDRGGIKVNQVHKLWYEKLIALIRLHGSGDYIYATPDCPEVYFLSGFKNPTRTLFDFFESPLNRKKRLMRILEEKNVMVVAINQAPSFSPKISAELKTALMHRFPFSREIGPFVVRWRK
jgi:hypothetical protein